MAVLVAGRTRTVAKVGAGFVGFILCAALWVVWRLSSQSMPDVSVPPGPIMPAINGANTIAAAAKIYKANAAVKGFQGDVTRPEAPLWAVKQAVAMNQPALALLRKGLRQACQYPAVRHASDVPSLYLDEVRLAEFLACEGRVYESRRDWRRAADSYLDCIELAARFNHNSGMLPQLVGVLMAAIGTDPLAGLLDRCDGKTAAYIRDRLLELYPQCGDTVAMMREAKYESLVNLQQWGHTGRGYGMGYGWQERHLLWYYTLSKKTVIQNCISMHDDMIQWASEPAWRRGELKFRRTDPVNEMATPLYSSAANDTDKKLCRLRLVLIRAAIIAWKDSHGRPPDSLAVLGLPAPMIRETFRDSELVYKPATMTVYSVGPDRKDDGGRFPLDIVAEPDPPMPPPINTPAKASPRPKPVTPGYRSARAAAGR